MTKTTEMIDRVARHFDPEAFYLMSSDGISVPFEKAIGTNASLILIARQEAACMRARALLFDMREPNKDMPNDIAIHWRRLIDAVLEPS